MIKIDWTQIKDLKKSLSSRGYQSDTEVMMMVLYQAKNTSKKIKLKLADLDQALYTLGSDHEVIGLFIFDIHCKKPLWRVLETPRIPGDIEKIPTSGHALIVEDFGDMSREQRSVWMEIVMASIQEYLSNEV